ncbi:MAG: glycosyltransferase family 4 protein [Lachnospiraceae bacterium]|nr:glycosyltransferase family 4 protein [Lachnospiraceae bacterium]
MKRLLIVTNQPAPYRVDFFIYLQESYAEEYDIWVLFSTGNESSERKWKANEEKLKNKVFLKSKVFKFRSSYDTSEKIITYGAGKRLDEIRPDVVVCSEYNFTSLAVKHWCNKNSVPFISWTDGTRFSERNIKPHQKLFRKYIIRKSAAFIASSASSMENQISLGADMDKIHISELAVDIRQYENAGKNYKANNTLIAVGSFIERKGIDLLFKALALIKDLDWKLKLVGDGPEREKLEAEARRLGILEKTEFAGFLSGDELTRAYESSGIFVFPTREDCFGLVTMEAMCCGLPCIVSKYAASSYDLIDNLESGVIIDPYDSEKFAAVIQKLLNDDSLKISMSEAARSKVNDFAFDKTAEPFIEAVKAADK